MKGKLYNIFSIQNGRIIQLDDMLVNPPHPPMPERRNIWIRFSFIDPSYNPKAHQLATGKACTKTDSVGDMERQKGFSADWQLIDPAKNEWMWGVTAGTDISHAFTTMAGDLSTPTIIGTDWLESIPESMAELDGFSSAECQTLVDNGTWSIVPSTEFTGHATVSGWNLDDATDLSFMFGATTWIGAALYGNIPGVAPSSADMQYMLSRCYHVDAVGAVDASGDIDYMFYSMTGLGTLPDLTVQSGISVSGLFANCGNVVDAPDGMFLYLDSMSPSAHLNTFTNCGILEDAHSLDNIPTSWGGNAILVGTNVDGHITPLAVGGKVLRF